MRPNWLVLIAIAAADVVLLSLNIHSIKAKFDNFFGIINRLSSLGIFIGAICLQET